MSKKKVVWKFLPGEIESFEKFACKNPNFLKFAWKKSIFFGNLPTKLEIF